MMYADLAVHQHIVDSKSEASMPPSNDNMYSTLPLLGTSFPPSPPQTPSLNSKVSPTQRSSMAHLPTNPRDSTCLPQTYVTFQQPPFNLTPPQSQCFTPAITPSPYIHQSQCQSRADLERQIFLPQGPNDFSCLRLQSRQAHHKIYIPGRSDTTCPYSIPKRSSSLQTGATTYINTRKISKPAPYYTRQPSRHRQPTRTSSASSASSASSRCSSRVRNSSLSALQTALATQAHLSGPSQSQTFDAAISIDSTISSSEEISYLSDQTFIANQIPFYISANPPELYPLYSPSPLNPMAVAPSIPTSYSPVPSLSQPSSAASSLHSSPSIVNSSLRFTHHPNLAEHELFNESGNLAILASYHSLATVDHQDEDPTMTAPLSAAAPASSVMVSPGSSSCDLSTNSPSTVNPFSSRSTSQTGVSETPPDTGAASNNGGNPVDYTNIFVPTDKGGTGMLLDTSRLRGRVIRPWN